LAKSRSDEINKITADEIADNVLSVWISEHHPELFEHQKRIAKLEAELLKTLK
jgi:hypothetical protein